LANYIGDQADLEAGGQPTDHWLVVTPVNQPPLSLSDSESEEDEEEKQKTITTGVDNLVSKMILYLSHLAMTEMGRGNGNSQWVCDLNCEPLCYH
jgi:hypothetical protein